MSISSQRAAAAMVVTLTAWLTVLVAATGIGYGSQQRSDDAARTAARIDTNVVYGMYSGLALLMDVYHPVRPNGYGIVLIPGRGWSAPMEMNARPLKNEGAQVKLFAPPLLAAGYTLFVVDHRAAPRFHYPSQLEDVARAVRFIRQHAAEYKISDARLGGMGYSAGANLVALLGTKPDEPNPDAREPLARQSARLQCLVAGGTPADLTSDTTPDGYQLLSAYLGVPVSAGMPKDSAAYGLLVAASPVTYVTADDAPTLFFGGNQDQLVPLSNVRRMADALKQAGVRSSVIEIDAANHWPITVAGAPDFLGAMVEWFDQCLKRPGSN